MSTIVRAFAAGLIVLLTLTFAACGSGHGVNNCLVPPVAGASSTTCTCGSDGACAAPQYLYASNSSGQITGFQVNPSSGQLTTLSTTSGAPAMSLGMAALANSYVYESDFVHSNLYAWTVNFGDGSLTPVTGSPFNLGQFSVPTGIATNQNAQVVYVGDLNSIDALQVNASGMLTPLASSPVLTGSNFFLTMDSANQFVFASDDDPPGGVFAFTTDSAGNLTAVAGSPFFAIPNYNGNTLPGQIVVDQTNSFVYTTLTNTNQVAGFAINKPQGTLTVIPGSPFAAGTRPTTLVATVNGFLYVSNGQDGTVSGYSINQTTGVLTPVANSPFPIRAASFAVSAGGSYIYATGSAGIQAFSLNAATGALTPLSGSPFSNPGAALLTYVF